MSCVGTGAFGTVRKVIIDHQTYALKQISLQFDTPEDSQQLRQVSSQARLLQRCKYHPNIVRYYHSFRKQDHFYILMQYVSGCTLADLPTPLSYAQTLNLLVQLALALRHLKQRSIVHRDIKPANILISQNGLIKLVDLGIGKSLSLNEHTHSSLGTPFYTAPQVYNDQPHQYAVDIWSLGVVLYQVTHGLLPFVAQNMQDLKKAVRKDQPVLDIGLGEELVTLIKGCLKKNPKERWTVQQILGKDEQMQNFLQFAGKWSGSQAIRQVFLIEID